MVWPLRNLDEKIHPTVANRFKYSFKIYQWTHVFQSSSWPCHNICGFSCPLNDVILSFMLRFSHNSKTNWENDKRISFCAQPAQLLSDYTNDRKLSQVPDISPSCKFSSFSLIKSNGSFLKNKLCFFFFPAIVFKFKFCAFSFFLFPLPWDNFHYWIAAE